MTNFQVPDQLAEQIQTQARAEGLSVHEFLQRVLREHQQLKREDLSASDITARLDALYLHESSTLDSALLRLQNRSLEREAW